MTHPLIGAMVLMMAVQLVSAQAPGTAELDRAIEALRGGRRGQALEILRRDPAASAPRLLDALAATPLQQRAPLSDALIELGGRALPVWAEAIAAGPTERRVAAIRATESFDSDTGVDRSLIDQMVTAMTDPSEQVAGIAGYSLMRRHEQLVPILEARLDHDDYQVRLRAAILLGSVRHTPRMPFAVRLAGTEHLNTYYRYWAYQQLSTAASVDVWRPALDDAHRWIRHAALAVVADLAADHPECIADLVAFLARNPPIEWDIDTSEEWTLHTSLLPRLPALGAAAVPVLQTALSRAMPGELNGDAACEAFYQAALQSVAEIGPPAHPVRPLILSQLDRPGVAEPTRAAALDALSAVLREDTAAADVARFMAVLTSDSGSAATLASACRGLAKCGVAAAPAIPALQRLARGPIACGAASATLVALAHEADQTRELVHRVLRDQPPSERTHHEMLCAALAASEATFDGAIDDLLALFNDLGADHSLREAAVLAAGRIAGRQRDADPETARRVAQVALAEREHRELHWPARRAAVLAWPQGAVDELVAGERSRSSLRGALVTEFPEIVVKLLDSPSMETRSRAANLLTSSPRPAAAPALLALATRPGAVRGRRELIRCIGRNCEGQLAVDAITRLWNDDVESAAIGALQEFGGLAVDPLRVRLRLQNLVAMSHAFCQIGSAAAPAVPNLLEQLDAIDSAHPDDEDAHGRRLRESVYTALAFTGAEGQRALARLPIDPDQRVAALCAAATTNNDLGVRARAAQELLMLGERIPGLSARGFSRRRVPDDPDSARMAMDLVTWIQLDPEPEDPLGLLLFALAMPQPEVRLLAVRELPTAIDDRATCDRYLRLLEDDPSTAVREAARVALQRPR